MAEEHKLRVFENRVLRGTFIRKKMGVAYPSGRSLAGIAGSNPAGNMDVCVLWMLCVDGPIPRPDESYLECMCH